jgi:predicted 3-demethylubiquinone-9 3-methyltransferase (glyoxalase superfamily)
MGQEWVAGDIFSMMTKRVSTHLMFFGKAAEALDLYSRIFPEFKVESLKNAPDGSVRGAQVSFQGHSLIVIDSPAVHAFTFTPAMSLFVDFTKRDELDAAFAELSSGGQVFMPLDNYGFSERFGWCCDRFGVSWQLNLEGLTL